MAKRNSHNLEKTPNPLESLRLKVDRNNSYQTLPSSEKLGKKTQPQTSPEIISRKSGPRIAPQNAHPMARTPQTAASEDTTPLDPISNAGVLHIPDEKDVPNEYEFEILRLRRRVEELECVVRDRDERNVRAISMLEDEMQYWRTYLHDHVGETFSGIQRRVMRIESTLLTLREKGSRVYPPLDLPAGWKELP